MAIIRLASQYRHYSYRRISAMLRAEGPIVNHKRVEPQSVVEAPRFVSYGFPSSIEPHDCYPGRVSLESHITEEAGEALTGWGHDVQWWPEWIYLASSVCTLRKNAGSGVLNGAADPRRTSYVSAW